MRESTRWTIGGAGLHDGESRPYFVRDDDVGELTGGLKVFAETFAAVEIPVSYQIIPSRLTEPCAEYLLSLQQQYPQLVDFGQHGLHHRMTLNGRELKREFGPERSLEDQSETIRRGRDILRQRLGAAAAAIEVFTPPQHKFDGNTIKAAAAAGYRIFSAACYPTLHHQLAYAIGRGLGLGAVGCHGISYDGEMRPEAPILEMSIAIDADDGRRRKRNAVDIERSLRAVAPLRSHVGLMFHHALYAAPEARQELASIAVCLASIGRGRFGRLRLDAPGGETSRESRCERAR
jgi:hypothetical protein